MNENKQNSVSDSMLDAVRKKYNKEFSVEYFQAAIDETYSNILTLSSDGYIFNVYQTGDDEEISDDLIQAVFNKKLTDSISEKAGGGRSDFKLYVNFMFSGIDGYSYEKALETDADSLIKTNRLLKSVAVVSVPGELSEYKDLLFDIYKTVLSYDPEYCDFEFIQLQGTDEELNKMLNNLTGYYDSDWSRFEGVKEYVSVSDKDISSPDNLLRR